MSLAFQVLCANLLLVAGNASLVFGSDTVSVATNSALAEHLSQLRVPPGFTLVVQPPFVVLGDESPAMVRSRATNTVKWAVDRLKLDYFRRDPAEVIDIWLFRDRASYTNHAWLLFRDTPTTPYGY